MNQDTDDDTLICKFTRSALDNRLLECITCADICTKAAELNEMKLHQKTEIVCGFCDKQLRSKISFQFHLNSFHQDKVDQKPTVDSEMLYIETVKEEDIAIDDQIVVEEDVVPWMVDEVIDSCLFVADPEITKNVKCVKCEDYCPVEDSINSLKPHEVAEIPCQCGQTLNDRQSFYKHSVFFHGESTRSAKKKPKVESMEIEDAQLLDCNFKYDVNEKTINCLKHLDNEDECEHLADIRNAKASKELNILCFCGRTLKTRLSFQKHCEHLHNEADGAMEDDEQFELEEIETSVTPQMPCRFTRDPSNNKSLVCVVCTTSKCPMYDRIQSSKFFEELYVPCECGKVLKNRCNFLKHFKIFHELGLGTPAGERKMKRSRSKKDEEFELSAEDYDLSEMNCRFDKQGSKMIVCVNCNYDCDFAKRIRAADMNRELNIPCFCGVVIKSRKRYLQHHLRMHGGGKEKRKSCLTCKIEFECNRDKMAHDQKVHGIDFKHECEHCHRKFFRSDYLSYHLESCGKTPTVRMKHQTVFACGVCNFTFLREDTFQKHLETAHQGIEVTHENLEIIQSGKPKTSEEAEKYKSRRSGGDFKCTHCPKSFVNAQVLHRHVKQIHERVVMKCDHCDEVFVHETTRQTHMVKEHGVPRAFNCKICSYACDKRNRFQAHMAKHQNPNQKFSCPICEQEFNSFDTMQLHRSRHKMKEPLVCEFCEKQFINRQTYHGHLKLHTREDLVRCPTCNKGFVRKYTMQAHMQRCTGAERINVKI